MTDAPKENPLAAFMPPVDPNDTMVQMERELENAKIPMELRGDGPRSPRKTYTNTNLHAFQEMQDDG